MAKRADSRSTERRVAPRARPSAVSSAGYSGTPLPQKLGIAAGMRVCFVAAPDGYVGGTLELPDGVTPVATPRAPLDLVQIFVTRAAELERGVPRLAALLAPKGRLWVSWPKKTSGVESDVTEDVVRKVALAHGLVDVKVCAVDATWSGLKLVVRAAPARAG